MRDYDAEITLRSHCDQMVAGIIEQAGQSSAALVALRLTAAMVDSDLHVDDWIPNVVDLVAALKSDQAAGSPSAS